jgi:hypothetical protein
MIDLYRLTRFPAQRYKNIQFSSYDRRSAVPGGKEWFANSDGFGEEPIPNFEAVLQAPHGDAPGEYLMCDVTGPGAIVRLWTAGITGSIRVYLDDAETPLYDGPAEAFFLRPYNPFLKGTGINPEIFTGTLHQRNASYAPVPFEKRCRIVWTGNHKDIHFYHIQIRKYAKGAQVVTFSPADLFVAAQNIQRVTEVLADMHRQRSTHAVESAKMFSLSIPPHTLLEGIKLEGGGALEQLALKLEAPRLDEALRKTILYIQCDGVPWPQVQSPIGDFFGTGPGINPYTSLPFTVAPDGTMTCRYVMPYKESLRIILDNRSDQTITISGTIGTAEYDWDDASMYFRARWRVNHNLVANAEDCEEMGPQDLPFLLARGQGVYVGTAIMLLNPNNVPSTWGNWWGEGDEKIFVDDDVFPSIFGTGSEDYFNYAWSEYDLFAFPYCGQTRNDGPANRGFVSNFRWHILDPIPFTHSIAFYMELISHERTESFSYARISYHYGREGLIDDHVVISDEDVRLLRLPDTWEPLAHFGAARCVFFTCEDLVENKSHTSFEKSGLWQGGRLLVWTPVQKHEELKITFQADVTGEYDISLACKLCPGAGKFKARLDDQPVTFENKEWMDLNIPHHILSRLVGTHAVNMEAGEHNLILTASEAKQSIGLDFFVLRKH